MKYTCSVCGRITDEQQCPDHRPAKPSRHWSKNRSSRKQQNFRVAVLKRDGHRCRRCGSTKDLRACHWPIPFRAFPKDDPAAYDPANGRTLCESCDRATDPYAR
jgi:5-methylcytosine-specific restriction endonuclease McrA